MINNLYYDCQKREYRDLESETVVVKIEDDDFVLVHKLYLKCYLCVKKASMLVQIDSRYYSQEKMAINENKIIDLESDDKICSLFISQDKSSFNGKMYSMLYAKCLISGVSIDKCGYWPYDSMHRTFEDFCIGYDKDGVPITCNSNPLNLNNLFDSKAGAPQYLTPVFFSREVLKKYYDNPIKYRIEDGILQCGTKWLLQIDNQNDNYVSAYLGDLGRDLPNYEEQQYWKQFNIIIDGTLSNTKVKRDFASIFAEPDSPIFKFQNSYRTLNKDFEDKYGWLFFKSLHQDDAYCFNTIRLPISNSQAEFDTLVLSLVKIVIDSLNEEKIKEKITGEIPDGGIKRLEKWLEESDITDYKSHIEFLRNLQFLRSCSTAHRKGNNYEKAVAKLNISSNDLKEGFKSLIIKSIEFITYIQECIDLLN